MDYLFLGVEAVLAVLLLGMVVMVFGNVVLRYAFNSGIGVSEELSRIFFVWLTFIGAVLATHEGAHLGMDNVVSKLSRKGKIVCGVLSQALILLCCGMLFWGTLRQHEINATTLAPVTGMPMSWVFGMGYVTSIGVGVHALHRLWRLLSGRMTDAELVEVKESEEVLPDAPHGGPNTPPAPMVTAGAAK
ncbi:TRAP transporter small permease protein [Rhodoferax koreense]|uniref:TRAP transporter small permease protein n=1 Tax=Rhodoferax koreensis TaxID=1842727 RepID=A0A1P8K0V0_9BURK|nr:TRAP transporter small permease protein [Rhodoferax koreense]